MRTAAPAARHTRETAVGRAEMLALRRDPAAACQAMDRHFDQSIADLFRAPPHR